MFVLFYTAPSSFLGAVFGILISLTPLASIFRLLSICFGPSSMFLDVSDIFQVHLSSFNESFMSSSYNDTASSDFAEKIMSVFFNDLQKTEQRQVIQSPLLSLGSRSILIQGSHFKDLSEVIPWIVSLVLFVIIPITMRVSAVIRNRGFENLGYPGRRRRDVLEEKRRRSFAIAAFKKCLSMCQMIVSECDLKVLDTEVDDSHDNQVLFVPIPGCTLNSSSTYTKEETKVRPFVGSCAICLSTYKIGETVVWSSNPECHDIFHEKCFMSWIQKKHDPICCCCRQQFVLKELFDRVLPTISSSDVFGTDPLKDS